MALLDPLSSSPAHTRTPMTMPTLAFTEGIRSSRCRDRPSGLVAVTTAAVPHLLLRPTLLRLATLPVRTMPPTPATRTTSPMSPRLPYPSRRTALWIPLAPLPALLLPQPLLPPTPATRTISPMSLRLLFPSQRTVLWIPLAPLPALLLPRPLLHPRLARKRSVLLVAGVPLVVLAATLNLPNKRSIMSARSLLAVMMAGSVAHAVNAGV